MHDWSRLLTPVLVAALVGVPGAAWASDAEVSVEGVQLQDWRGVEAKAPVPALPSRTFFDRVPAASLSIQVAAPEKIDALGQQGCGPDAASDEKCFRIGVVVPVTFDPGQAGPWAVAQSGGHLWLGEITSPGATSMRVHFEHTNMPEGAVLYVYSAAFPHLPEGPFMGTGLYDNGDFWSPPLDGDHIFVEYYEPEPATPAPGKTPFTITEVVHNSCNSGENIGPCGAAGACNLDATCSVATWGLEIDATAQLQYIKGGGGFCCTGQLLNSQCGDFTPYMLTAYHCIDSNTVANTLICTWNWRSSTCNGALPSFAGLPKSNGATFLSGSSSAASSDYTLLLIDGALPGGRGWVGWTSEGIGSGVAVTSIHHPKGDAMKISSGTSQAACWDSDFLCVQWSSGITEGGSSGGGLYRTSDRRLIGQLRGGASFCATPTGIDDYGRYSTTYPNISSWLACGSDDGLEEDDSCAAARTVSSGTVNGLVVKYTDEDWYKISVPAYTRLTVSLSFTHANGDIDLAAYSVCGGAIIASSTTSANTETVNIDNNSAGAVTYYWRVYLFGDTRNNYNMTVTLVPICQPPVLSGAVSRKTHTGAGNFDINLPLAPASLAGVEHRKGGPTQVILTFSESIRAADGSMTRDQEVTTQVNGAPVLGLITSLGLTGNQLTVNLANVGDVVCLRLILAGIEDLTNCALEGDNDVHIVVLFGDVTGDYVVNIVDLSTVKPNLFEPVNGARFRSDLNRDGVINIVDLSDIKAKLFHQKQCP